MKTVYVNSEGIICGLTKKMPKRPEFKGDYFLHYGPQKQFESELESLKQSAVPFEDQEGVRKLVVQNLYSTEPPYQGEWVYTAHSDKFYEIQQDYEIVRLNVPSQYGVIKGTYEVARLIPSPKEEDV